MAMIKNERGAAFLVMLTAVVVMVPALLFLGEVLHNLLKSATKEKHIVNTADLPQNALVDYMRQFAQNPALDWSDPAQFNRPDAFYSAGFSSVTVTSNVGNRTIQVRCEGTFRNDVNDVNAKRREMVATLGFRNDLLKYATINQGLTISDNNKTLGPTYVEANATVTGANTVFNGDLVVTGNVSLSPSTQVNGNLYHGGTYNNAGTVTGTVFPYAYPVTWPMFDFAYWVTRANLNPWANPVATLTFVNNGTVVVNAAVGSGTYATTGPAGLIIVVEGQANIIGDNNPASSTGKVRGHVTVVASTVTITNSLVYANGTNQADASDSLAIYAFNPVLLTKSDPSVNVMRLTAMVWPVYFRGVNCHLSGGAGGWIATGSGSNIVYRWLDNDLSPQLIFTGTTFTGINRVCDDWVHNDIFPPPPGVPIVNPCAGTPLIYNGNVTVTHLFDPNLSQFPPPGLPSRCTILDYRESIR